MVTTSAARPTGVSVLAVLAAIGGALVLLAGLALMGIVGAAGAGGAGILPASAFGIISIAQGVLLLAFAYGAWSLRPWAWMVGIASSALGLVLAALFIANGSEIPSQIVSIAVNVLIISFLNSTATKRAFGRA